MVFQCIKIRQVPREVLKPAACGLGFQHFPRDLANVNAWKTMFDPYNETVLSPRSGHFPSLHSETFRDQCCQCFDYFWIQTRVKSLSLIKTLVMLSPDIPCLCKQCISRSVGFFRSQLIWICTVCHQICEFIATIQIKQSDWLKIRSGCGNLIYSAGQGLNEIVFMVSLAKHLAFQNTHK